MSRRLYNLVNPSDAITFWATPIEAAIIADRMLEYMYFVKDVETGASPKIDDLRASYDEIWSDADRIASYAEAYRSFLIASPNERRRTSMNDICTPMWEAGDRIALCHPEERAQ